MQYAGSRHFSMFDCKEYNQSDFSIGHPVMSICRVFSCVDGRWCLLWPLHFSWRNSTSLCPATFCTPRTNLPVTPHISYFLLFHSSPLWWKGHLNLVLVWEGLIHLHNLSTSAALAFVLGHGFELLWDWLPLSVWVSPMEAWDSCGLLLGPWFCCSRHWRSSIWAPP